MTILASSRRLAVAALALALAAGAGAQPGPAPGAPAPPAVPVDTTNPAVKRALELTRLLARADQRATRAYVEGQFAPGFRDQFPMGQHLAVLSGAYDVTRGFERPMMRPPTPTSATVIYRSPVLDDWLGITVEVEPAPPHRITGVVPPRRARPPEGERPLVRHASDAAAAAALEAYVTRLAAADQFSGVVLVARGATPVWAKGFGEASKEYGVPNRADTRMILGSINKMFTATAILQLVEQGKLSLDDSVGKWLPGVLPPDAEQRVRIRHLLTHTSGLGDFLFTDEMENVNRARYRTIADYLPSLKDDALAFAPGTRWQYSNAGFLVLGAIIEKVTGRAYDAHLADAVLRPAGMTATGGVELDRVPKGIAFNYRKEYTDSGPAWRSTLYDQVVRGTPAGGGYSTAADLHRFLVALRANALLGPELTKAMLSPKPELSSPAYGYGIQILDPGGRFVGHTGGGPGTAAVAQMDLESDLIVIAISNVPSGSSAIVRRAYDIFPVRAPVSAR